jgi:hypothetical protein
MRADGQGQLGPRSRGVLSDAARPHPDERDRREARWTLAQMAGTLDRPVTSALVGARRCNSSIRRCQNLDFTAEELAEIDATPRRRDRFVEGILPLEDLPA